MSYPRTPAEGSFRAMFLNRGCIKKPIRTLKRGGHEVHVVYLRREYDDDRSRIVCLVEMDELMNELADDMIPSKDDLQAKQGPCSELSSE